HNIENEIIFTTSGHIFPLYKNMRNIVNHFLLNNSYIKNLEKNLKIRFINNIKNNKIIKNELNRNLPLNTIYDDNNYNAYNSIFLFQSSNYAMCTAQPFTFHNQYFNNYQLLHSYYTDHLNYKKKFNKYNNNNNIKK